MSNRAVRWAVAALIIAICAFLALQTLTLRLGLHYYRTGDDKRALPWLRAAMVFNPFTPSIRNAAAAILIKEGKLQNGELILADNLRNKPDDPHSHNLMGMILERRGKLTEALSEYDKAIEADSDYGEAFFNKGYVLFKLRRYDESVAALDKAVSIMPELSRQRDEIMKKIPPKEQ